MNNIVYNLVGKERRVFFSRIKRKILSQVLLVRLFLLVCALAIIFLLVSQILRLLGFRNFYTTFARNFIFTPKDEIESYKGRTNILVLGKGGAGHEAPDLTDTIIFVSFNHQKSTIESISLPRDIWIPELRAKLNSTYYWGNQKAKDGGIILTKAEVERILGQPVHYALVVSFSDFVSLIDTIGGIVVNVEKGFVDEKFPIPGKEADDCGGDPEFKCRYKRVEFVEGEQLMDGETALEFVRSRNAKGDEGNDFARAARQQLVIYSILKKILSKDVLFSPKKILAIKEFLTQKIETDLTDSAIAILSRRIVESRGKISSFVLPAEFLVNPPKSAKYDNLYVLIPRSENWDEVKRYVECLLTTGNCG